MTRTHVVTLDKYADVSSSKRIYASEYVDSGIPFYRGKEVVEGIDSNKTNTLFISHEKFKKIKDRFGAPVAGDILLTSVGTLGVPYYVKGDHEFYFKDGNLTWFRNFRDLDSKWLYYWIQSNEGKGALKKCEIGSSQKAYTIKRLSTLEFPYFDLKYQKQLVDVIATYDDLIENNQTRIKIIEEMAQRLYTEWFVKFKFPGHEKLKMVDSGTEFGKIPEGWEVMSIDKAIKLNPLTKHERGESIRHIGMACISESASVIDINGIEEKNKPAGVKFKNKDTLFSRITPCLQNGKTAYVNFLSNEEVASGSTEFLVMREHRLTPTFIYLLSRSQKFRKAAILAMIGASGRQRVHASFYKKYLVIVPTQELLQEFESVASRYFELSNSLNNRNHKLAKTRDLLIENLITGKRELKN